MIYSSYTWFFSLFKQSQSIIILYFLRFTHFQIRILNSYTPFHKYIYDITIDSNSHEAYIINIILAKANIRLHNILTNNNRLDRCSRICYIANTHMCTLMVYSFKSIRNNSSTYLPSYMYTYSCILTFIVFRCTSQYIHLVLRTHIMLKNWLQSLLQLKPQALTYIISIETDEVQSWQF